MVGDAVEFKGLMKKYNSTYELDGSSTTCELTLIAQLHKPTISPNGGSFTSSQSVTLSADSGSTIHYTTNGNNPTASSSVYSSALNLTATTTVKAIAIKGILTTGVASAEFTNSSGGSNYQTSGTLASWVFSSTNYPSNKTNFTATSGVCSQSTFYLNGTGSTWNTPKGYAFTAVTDVTITIKAVKPLKAGSSLTLSMDTYYNKESNAPMKGFSIKASESGGSSSTTGLNVTS